MTTQLPTVELVDLLRSAYDPCAEFNGACRDVARWAPQVGHVPRGYFGAHGALGEVEVILLLAEPGDPLDSDTFECDVGASELIMNASTNTQRNYEKPATAFHSNMRKILRLLFPEASFGEQLRKAWISETYLCSAPTEGGRVPSAAERACAGRFLSGQLSLLSDCPVIALGGKAQARVRRLVNDVPGLERRLIDAWAASPPGANNPRAGQSWERAAKQVHAFRRQSAE